jgi:hypothetical protein
MELFSPSGVAAPTSPGVDKAIAASMVLVWLQMSQNHQVVQNLIDSNAVRFAMASAEFTPPAWGQA